ncbi:4'-phosphopantetheinyl transferase superfamily protein [Micromonospora sp. NPDC049559]|uniref:4'-phosphopantetheinyl transferase family protein n=1 Tax=Micromonospora sp. NPDC049559 TaxID=3155923 RepID=UPI003448552D
MVEEILPPVVVAVEAFDDPPGVPLFPEEEAVIRQAVEKRRREFTTARHCARTALARLGLPPAPIVPGQRGAPRWPAGVVGSMTHCAGYRAAALGHARELVTVGLDAEPHAELPRDVLPAVSLPGERRRLGELTAARPEIHWDRLLFSAKESVYKAWFPLTGRWLGFAEADVVFEPGTASFTARLLVDGPAVGGVRRGEFRGRYLVRDGLLVTAIAVLPG